MAHIFSREFSISSYDLNPRAQARLTTIANFFQELAYHHASELGVGYDALKERGNTWVLSRMRIQMDRYPLWNDRIVIETWPSGREKLFALREFRVLDEKGQLIGKAGTAWLILDIKTHRLIRPEAEFERFKLIVYDEHMFGEALGKVSLPDELQAIGEHKVVFSDLDILGHVNNVKYLEWCIDAALSIHNRDREIRELEINFSHEALLDEMVTIRGGGEAGEEYRFQARREGDNQEIFRARLRWVP
jgi:acyl-ACP thioesterase